MNERMSIDPAICHGKPVIKGTRVLVGNILGALSAGDSIEDVLVDYPSIVRDDVLAALDFAAQISRFEESPFELCPA